MSLQSTQRSIMARPITLALVLLLGCLAASAQAQNWNPLAFLTLPKISLAVESTSDTANQDACTISNAYTKPQLARVSVCAQSRAVSANGAGAVTSWSNSTLRLRNQASIACSEAIGRSVRGLCTGGDPMAAISTVASACAAALVEMQMESLSGVQITPATNVSLVRPDRRSFANGCANGCANGQMSAEAVAQASACAWVAATKGCNAVRVALSSQNYAQAFIRTTAAAWSNACAVGVGSALSRGTSLANSAVTVLSRAMGEVVANACSGCDTCKCRKLPPGFSYDKMDQLSNASAIASGGVFTMGKALTSAVASYCDSDRSSKALQTDVNAVINTMAVSLAQVMVSTSSNNTARGVSMACSSGRVTQQIRMSRMAFINALNDATSLVFDQCASANVKMKQMVNSLEDSLDRVFNSVSSQCATASGSSTPKVVNTRDVVRRTLQQNKPVVKAIAEALQDSVSCGCKPGNCFFCKPAPVANATNVVSSFDLGNNKTGTASGKVPLNWNELSGATGH